ncbi:MAG TPA: prolyl oligopeptidase family serine peptidase [Trueperaceae bacterium]|nr:prolyl oligopeptidase family serine peptidase [Trueperaceae bacterium]
MPQSENAFTARIELDVSLRYLLYLPAGIEERGDWPLILFLHGAGERGDDLSLVLKQGLPRLLHEGLTLPAVVVSPQLPADQMWAPQVPAVRALLADVMARYPIDEDRVTVTGLSLGGAGTCEMVRAYPDTFAAVAPICGPWTRMLVNDQWARIPTWVFHGDADPLVPVEDSHRLVDELRSRGGEPRLTVFPGVGHNSWDPAYQDPAVLTWLLQQRRGSGTSVPD